MFRLCYIIVCIAFPLSFLSCSSANFQISDCEINQETNFFVTEEIKKWILEKKMKKKTNFNEVIQKLRNADYHHILD